MRLMPSLLRLYCSYWRCNTSSMAASSLCKAFSCSCSCCTDKISTPEKSTKVRMEKMLMLISLPGRKPRLLTAKAVSASMTAVRAALPPICKCPAGWGRRCCR